MVGVGAVVRTECNRATQGTQYGLMVWLDPTLPSESESWRQRVRCHSVCLCGRGRDREGGRPHRHHWATMTCVLHCHKHLGVHEKCMRTNIFGRMCVYDMSRLVAWSGLRMTLSLRASVSGCDNTCDLWKMISMQSTCKRAERPSPPHRWLPGHSQEANSSGTDCKKGKNLRCMCGGRG